MDIESFLLEAVVGRDSVEIREIELYAALNRWATNELDCKWRKKKKKNIGRKSP